MLPLQGDAASVFLLAERANVMLPLQGDAASVFLLAESHKYH
jgi:hypothetical protein